MFFLRRAVLVQCMSDIIFAVLNQCYGKALYNFMQRLHSSTNSIMCILYNSWFIQFKIWNHWINLTLHSVSNECYCIVSLCINVLSVNQQQIILPLFILLILLYLYSILTIIFYTSYFSCS